MAQPSVKLLSASRCESVCGDARVPGSAASGGGRDPVRRSEATKSRFSEASKWPVRKME